MPDTPRVGSGDKLLTPSEVAALFRVDPKTVTRWAAAGKIGSIRTPGGHRRFRESEVKALLLEEETGGLVGLDPLDPEVLKAVTGQPAVDAVRGERW